MGLEETEGGQSVRHKTCKRKWRISKSDKGQVRTDNEQTQYKQAHRQIQVKSNVSKIKLAKVPNPYVDVSL